MAELESEKPKTDFESNSEEPVQLENEGTTQKEKELLDIVFSLESEKQTLIEDARARIIHMKKEIEGLQCENDKLKKKNSQLEQNAKQKSATNGDAPKLKKEQEDIITKAKTLLFEKTKTCKQQERHIDMLKVQVNSVKEVLGITQDMLKLRNTEVEHLQARLDTFDVRIKAEHDKQQLLEKKLNISKKMFTDLRTEYECQASIFKELKSKYGEKVDILTRELAIAKGITTEETN